MEKGHQSGLLARDAAIPASAASPPASALSRWCILRTSGQRTLGLAKSLSASGFDVWTPMHMQSRRVPQRKMRGGSAPRVEREVPILPTFVFARADRLADLYRVLALPMSPHPAFSIFRYNGRIPVIGDGEIQNLRRIEDRAKKRVRSIKRSPTFAVGQEVTVEDRSFTGLTGVVKCASGRSVLVLFGGMLEVKIDAFQLRADTVQTANT